MFGASDDYFIIIIIIFIIIVRFVFPHSPIPPYFKIGQGPQKDFPSPPLFSPLHFVMLLVIVIVVFFVFCFLFFVFCFCFYSCFSHDHFLTHQPTDPRKSREKRKTRTKENEEKNRRLQRFTSKLSSENWGGRHVGECYW